MFSVTMPVPLQGLADVKSGGLLARIDNKGAVALAGVALRLFLE